MHTARTTILRIPRIHRQSRRKSTWHRRILGAGIAALLVCSTGPVFAGSATWQVNAATGDWNTAANWTAGGPPNGAADVASFALSTTTAISLSANTEVNGIAFLPTAPAYTITATPTFTLTISGTGITNNSGVLQSFVNPTNGSTQVGTISFTNGATAGVLTSFDNRGQSTGVGVRGGTTQFFNTATAGSAAITNGGGLANNTFGGRTVFHDSSTAGGATIHTLGGAFNGASGGDTDFFNTSNAGSSHLSVSGESVSGGSFGAITFHDSSHAGTSTITVNGGTVSGGFGGALTFHDTSSAMMATITNKAGIVADAQGGNTFFSNPAAANVPAHSSTAGNATIYNEGSLFSGLGGGSLTFDDTGSAGNASITNYGGQADGAHGGSMAFFGSATAGTATIVNKAGTMSGAEGGLLTGIFGGTLGSATVTNEGASVSGALGGRTDWDSSSAGSANISNNAATVTGAGASGSLNLTGTSTAGTATISNQGSAVPGALGGTTTFSGSATAGSAGIANEGGTAPDGLGGVTRFNGTSSAGTGIFTMHGGTTPGAGGGTTIFGDTATASSGNFTNNGGFGTGGSVDFLNGSNAGSGIFLNNGGAAFGEDGGHTYFHNTSSGATGHFTVNGPTFAGASNGTIEFFDTSGAGAGFYTINGGTVPGGIGGSAFFHNSSNAAGGIFNVNGATITGAFGGNLIFNDTADAGAASLFINGGTGGGTGASLFFFGSSTGGTSRVILGGDGKMDVSLRNAPGVTIGSLEGDGNAFLGANNLTVGSNNLNTTFSGVMQDGGNGGGTGGSFTKIGTGTLTLTGINTYTGNTNINGGVLAVNGSIASPSTFVNAGGTLGGTGFILGHVSNAGIVKPGYDHPGKLSIGGNYTQYGNGTLQIAVAGAQPGQFSVLAVGGTATLAGAVQVVREQGATLKNGDTLKILTADGGVSGTFSSSVNPFSTLGMKVIYEANDVLLSFTQSSFVPYARTPNQKSAATALDGIAADPRAAQVVSFLNSEPLSSIPGDLDRLGPADLTSIFHIAKSLANIQTANTERRMDEIHAVLEAHTAIPINSVNVSAGTGARGPVGKRSKEIAPAGDERWGTWFSGSGEFTHVGSTTNAAGFNLDSGGVTAGVDYLFTDHFAAGISLGYMNTTASLSNGGKVDVDGGRVGCYATYYDRGFHVDASVSGGPNGYKTRRTMPNNTVATASPGGTEVNLLLSTGYDWKFGGLTIGPTATFQYTNVQLDGFTETGTFAPLSVIRKNAESLRTALGIKAAYDAKVGRRIIRPEVRASWQHEYGDTTYSLISTFASLGGSAFTVFGPSTGRDSLLIGAGLSVLWNDRFSTYAFYDGELLRTNYSSNNVSVGCRWRF
jgi:outer membrane autotransporter protein